MSFGSGLTQPEGGWLSANRSVSQFQVLRIVSLLQFEQFDARRILCLQSREQQLVQLLPDTSGLPVTQATPELMPLPQPISRSSTPQRSPVCKRRECR